MIKCPECESENLALSIVRRLTYKIDCICDNEQEFGKLVATEEVEGYDDELLCTNCNHTWKREIE